MVSNEVKDLQTQAWKDRENARAYLAAVGLIKNLPIFEKFYNGEQWAAVNDKTMNMPRLVANIVKMICRNKKAAILSSPANLVFKTDDDKSAEKFTRFASYILKEIGQDDIDKIALSCGVKKGTYIYHYYWDAEAKGKKGQLPGAVRCEPIDPLNAYFSNPTEPDEQKQKWIMFESREEVASLKLKADKGVNKDLIVPDEQQSPYAAKEQEGTDMATVLTRYFRKNGEVFCEISTKTVVIKKAFSITPAFDEAMKEIENAMTAAPDNEKKARKGAKNAEGVVEREDAGNNALPDKDEGKNPATEESKAYLYPVVVGSYEPREKSIYGIGEVEGIIPNQRAINLLLSMMVYNVEQTAWGKYIVDKNALQGQKINNEPAQVLTDYTGTMNGIRRMEGQQLPAAAFNVVETITGLTRTVTGSSEVMTGETVGANMSGAAIAQLQSQALLPIEDLKQGFWNVKKKQGKVLAQFFKFYYRSKDFTYEKEMPVLDEIGNPVMDEMGMPRKQVRRIHDTFNSQEFRDADVEVVVDAVAGSRASVAANIALLDVMFQSGNISARDYVRLYPEDTVSMKTELEKLLEDKEQQKAAQLEQLAAQMKQQLDQATAQLQQQSEVFAKAQSIISENENLKKELIALKRTSTENMQKAAVAMMLLKAKGDQVTEDARGLASDLAKATGVM